MTTRRRVRVGLVGLGNSGWYYHAGPHLAGSPDFELVAVCSRDPVRAQAAARAFGGTARSDWRRVVDDPAVELVVVATPHDSHREIAVAAAEAGKHVLVEKPLATTTADADAVVEAAHRAGVVLAVHHQRREEADFLALRGLVASGALGQLRSVDVTRSHSGHYRTAGADQPHAGGQVLPWAHQRARGGGIAWVVGPHPVDHLLQLVGSRPTRVAGRTTTWAGEDVEDHLGADVRFASGVLGRVDVHRRPGITPPRFTVRGTRAAAVARTGSSVEVVPFDGEPYALEGLAPPGRHGEEVYAQLHRAITGGGPPAVTGEEARDVVEVLELALASAARGGVQLSTAAGR